MKSSPAPTEAGELRARILSASVALIEEQGLAALSMREVARRAGVSHQAPYHHFADREAILAAIAEEGFRELGAAMTRAIERRPGELASARIAGCGKAYVEFAIARPAHFRVMFRPELVDLERCPSAKAEGDRAFSALAGLVHDAVLEGLPATPSEEAMIALTWSVGHGLACLLLDGPLARKMPSEGHDEQIRGVVLAFESLLSASMSCARGAHEHPSKASPRKKR